MSIRETPAMISLREEFIRNNQLNNISDEYRHKLWVAYVEAHPPAEIEFASARLFPREADTVIPNYSANWITQRETDVWGTNQMVVLNQAGGSDMRTWQKCWEEWLMLLHLNIKLGFSIKLALGSIANVIRTFGPELSIRDIAAQIQVNTKLSKTFSRYII